MKKNVIITCSNEKYGDFLINHWLKSLRDNVNLSNIDVVIIDYYLNRSQKNKLLKEDVILFSGTKKYHIVNKRFFDALKFLKDNHYDQVLFIDGGDTIFQEDISTVFEKDKDFFRVVPLGMEVLFFEWFMRNNFEKKIKEEMWKVIRNKPVINAGVIFAPYKKFLYLCQQMNRLIKNKKVFGPDQVIVNYILYQLGVKLLKNKFNFMINTDSEGFMIKNGIFYKKNGERIAIVHNAGVVDFLRPIKNFGYGKQYNQLKFLTYHLKRIYYSSLGLFKKILSILRSWGR